MATNPPENRQSDVERVLGIDDLDPGLNEHAQPRASEVLDPQPRVVPQREPEVKVAPEPPEADRLAAALRTIEEQTQRIQGLEQSFVALRGQPPQSYQPRPEPQVEFEEVLPGRTVPKDSSKRPIRLTDQDLLRLGWNENPARAIESLANAFLGYIVDSIPQLTMQQYDQRVAIAQDMWNRKTYFWQQFPDLQEHETFVGMLEAEAQRAGFLTPAGKTQDVYNREVAGLARQRIAAMRGVTLDQYLSALPSNRTADPTPTRSRAVGSGGGGGRPRSQPQGQDRYLDDL